MLIYPERWQSLTKRYEQDRPHRMLALDGGGIRGLLTVSYTHLTLPTNREV